MRVVILISLLVSIIANADIKDIISKEAKAQGMDPKVALAIAQVESNFNPKAIGTQGEVGVFQLHPRVFPSAKYLTNEQRIKMGITHLLWWQKHCPVKDGYTWVVCYNAGYRKPKYPLLMPYYKRVVAAMQ